MLHPNPTAFERREDRRKRFQFPTYTTVNMYFNQWSDSGLLAEIYHHLRFCARELEGKRKRATAAIVDSQTIKSSDTAGQRGYDAGKKIKGIKRHLLVDTLGLVMALACVAG